MTRHRRRRLTAPAAFTLMELLVAVALTSLLLFLINQLFNDTREAVTTGIKTGEILVESETIGNQIARDANAMLGPNASPGSPAGFIVIVQRTIGEDPASKDGIYNGTDPGVLFPDPTGGEHREVVRSDQLVFITDSTAGGGTSPFTSITPMADDTLGSNITAPYARVWYGHVLRTNPDGAVGVPALGAGEPNLDGNTWAIGRQALLLTGSNSGVYVDGAEYGDTIIGYGGHPLWAGLSDVSNKDLVNGADGVLDDLTNATTYDTQAYAYTYAAERLRSNPVPDGGFVSWQAAQTHPYLAGNVSDFIVEFAGDYNPIDGKIDVDTRDAGDPNDDVIKWYTHDAFANEPSGTAPYLGQADLARPITFEAPATFQTGATTDPNDAYYNDAPGNPESNNADAIFVFRHDDGTGYDPAGPTNSKWPYLIRIRYRLHDVDGQVVSTNTAKTANGLDDDGDGDVDVDDPDEAVVSGQWFEHVIKVARPQ